MSTQNQLTLKLFNGVLAKESVKNPLLLQQYGVVIDPRAAWAEKDVKTFLKNNKLSGEDLNKTFHKSWEKIKESSREELLVDQILHYLSTYGTGFTTPIYIPDEVLDIPGVELKLVPIQAFEKEELVEKCLGLLRSGVALKEETLTDLLNLLDNLDFSFTSEIVDTIRNKEAVVKIAENCGVYPSDPTEFLRYLVYRATGETLLIKNEYLIELIKESSYNPSQAMKSFGLTSLSSIFNRFKPLFMAFKNKCPNTINKISKLSKVHHKPLVENPLNLVTQRKLLKKERHWLDNATPYAIFKAMSACHTRVNGQTAFLYQIRNGKSWVAEQEEANKEVCRHNLHILYNYLQDRFEFSGTKIYLPEGVEYALPTSEKLFVGNVPTGTKFFGQKLAVGIYWEDSWGARDLDLSGVNIGGKVGWNATYNQSRGSLMFSGDITSAPNGAVEYLYANKGLSTPTLVMNNVFSGGEDSGYKIIVGQGDDINKKYMMNPNNLMAEVRTQCVQKQMIVGIFLPVDAATQSFVALNLGAGGKHVSGVGEIADLTVQALYEQWSNPLTLKTVLTRLDAEIVDNSEDADFDLSLDKLEKDSFFNLFSF